ncbi:MAG: hypothetical protein R3F17_06180 [Planctomycetota bacterium]
MWPEEWLNRLRRAASAVSHPDRDARRSLPGRRKRRRDDDRDAATAALEATSNRARQRALRFPRPRPRSNSTTKPAPGSTPNWRAKRWPGSSQRVEQAQNCYVCKADYFELHAHYDSLCPECAALNWQKRHQTADLTGRVALLTGSRVKIGYEISLMLLRAGAHLIATTRFTADAAERFEQEPDVDEWRDRLELLRARPAPHPERRAVRPALARYAHAARLHHPQRLPDAVRRPKEFYQHLLDKERALEGRERNPGGSRGKGNCSKNCYRGTRAAQPCRCPAAATPASYRQRDCRASIC